MGNNAVGAGGTTVTVTGDLNEGVKTAKNETSEAFVKRQAYEEVSQDMHKFKAKARDAEARAAEYEAKLKAAEEAKMMDEKRYQELYEREKKDKELAVARSQKERELYLRAVKMTALKSELGNVKDEYLTHAAIDKIEIKDDGSLNSESVREVANQFRQNHPQLLPTERGGNITNFSSPTSFKPTGPKTLQEMTYSEKSEYLRNNKQNK